MGLVNAHYDRLPIGSVVGAGRIPFEAGHHEGWLPPLRGTVVALDDPRMWRGTSAFSTEEPNPIDVTRWVESCLRNGYLDGVVGVLWEFGRGFFEPAHTVLQYGEDHEVYLAKRAVAAGAEALRVGAPALDLAA